MIGTDESSLDQNMLTDGIGGKSIGVCNSFEAVGASRTERKISKVDVNALAQKKHVLSTQRGTGSLTWSLNVPVKVR